MSGNMVHSPGAEMTLKSLKTTVNSSLFLMKEIYSSSPKSSPQTILTRLGMTKQKEFDGRMMEGGVKRK